MGAIFLIDEAGRHLSVRSAPGLPEELVEAIDGLPVEERTSGSMASLRPTCPFSWNEWVCSSRKVDCPNLEATRW